VTLLFAIFPAEARPRLRDKRGGPQIDLYPRVSSSRHLVVDGRVLRSRARLVPAGDGKKGRALRENLGSLISDDLAGVPVTLWLGETKTELVSDESGFFHLDLELSPDKAIPPGTIALRASAIRGKLRATAEASMLVRPEHPSLIVVTDFDDTLVNTYVTDKSRFIKSVFFTKAKDLKAVPGMAVLFSCLAQSTGRAGPLSTAIHYLSASPVNFLEKVQSYLWAHRFPPGAIILRHLSASTLTDSQAYKRRELERLAKRFPEGPFLLVGDGGEKDPELYRRFAKEHPEREVTILIRRVEGEDGGSARFEGTRRFESGADAAAQLAKLGLIDPNCASVLQATATKDKALDSSENLNKNRKQTPK